MATEGQFLHKDWLDKCGKCETDLYQSSWISIDVRSLEKKLNAERATNKELEATCLQLRNEVLHLQGEAKRAYTRGREDATKQIVDWSRSKSDEYYNHRDTLKVGGSEWTLWNEHGGVIQDITAMITGGYHLHHEETTTGTRCDFRGCTNTSPMEEKEACENGWVLLGNLMTCPLCRKAVDADLARMEGREDERVDVVTYLQDKFSEDETYFAGELVKQGAHLPQGEDTDTDKGEE